MNACVYAREGIIHPFTHPPTHPPTSPGFPYKSSTAPAKLNKISKVMVWWTIGRIVWGIVVLTTILQGWLTNAHRSRQAYSVGHPPTHPRHTAAHSNRYLLLLHPPTHPPTFLPYIGGARRFVPHHGAHSFLYCHGSLPSLFSVVLGRGEGGWEDKVWNPAPHLVGDWRGKGGGGGGGRARGGGGGGGGEDGFERGGGGGGGGGGIGRRRRRRRRVFDTAEYLDVREWVAGEERCG